jgi:O-antigen/teichoic acid export membrane protein
MIAIWWAEYAATFLIAQVLTALGAEGSGSFVAYSSINLGYLLVQLPLLLLGYTQSITQILVGATASGAVALAVAAVLLVVVVRRFTERSRPPLTPNPTPFPHPLRSFIRMLRLGAPLAAARLCQASLPWIPVWALAFTGRDAEAAVYAIASRLAVIATSVLGALRFSSRHQIVRLLSTNNPRELESLSRKASAVASIIPILALILLPLLGHPILGLVFGPSYLPAIPVLIILMLAVLLECFGGLSDEIIKLAGHWPIALVTLATASSFQVLLILLHVVSTPIAMGVVVASAFGIEYVAQVLWLRLRTQISLWPRLFGRATHPALQLGASAW